MSNRLPRINSLIKEELAKIFLKEVDFPIGVLVTITRVKTSMDLANVGVYVSVFPSNKTPGVFKILDKVIYNVQKTLNRKLRMRPVPKIRFVKEEQIEEAAKIEGILNRIKEQEND